MVVNKVASAQFSKVLLFNVTNIPARVFRIEVVYEIVWREHPLDHHSHLNYMVQT